MINKPSGSVTFKPLLENLQQTTIKSGCTVIAVLLVLCAPPTYSATSTPNMSSHVLQLDENACLESRNSCLIAERTYVSQNEIKSNIQHYFFLNSSESLENYNHWMRKLESSTNFDSINLISSDLYNPLKKTWSPVSGIGSCHYCYHEAEIPTETHSVYVRLTLSDDIHANHDSFLSISQSVARNDRLNIYIIVKGSKGIPLYASTRLSGGHQLLTTLDNKSGYIFVALESKSVLSAEPDYFVISPYSSWEQVASIYKEKEAELISNQKSLPRYFGSYDVKISMIVRFMSGIKWHGANNVTSFFPWQKVDEALHSRTTDCKGLVTVFQAMLLKSGIDSHVISLNASGMPPLSFQVPSNWANHVIVYIPKIGKYVDISSVVFGNTTWVSSADEFVGEVALDVDTGKFVVM